MHALVAQLGGRRVPHWVNEGLATALEPGGLDRSRNVLSRAASRPSLKDLHGGFRGFAADSVSIAYATSAVAVDRMMDLRGGASGVVILLQDLGRGVPFETAFHRRMGLVRRVRADGTKTELIVRLSDLGGSTWPRWARRSRALWLSADEVPGYPPHTVIEHWRDGLQSRRLVIENRIELKNNILPIRSARQTCGIRGALQAP